MAEYLDHVGHTIRVCRVICQGCPVEVGPCCAVDHAVRLEIFEGLVQGVPIENVHMAVGFRMFGTSGRFDIDAEYFRTPIQEIGYEIRTDETASTRDQDSLVFHDRSSLLSALFG